MNAFFELSRENDKLLFCVDNINNSCEPHFHANIEVVLVLEGEMEVTINQQTKTLASGCVSVANSYDIHRYHTPNSSRCRVLIIPADTAHSFNVLSQTMTFTTPFLEICSRSEDIGDAISKLVKFDGTHDSMIAKGYIYVVLGILVEQLGITSREEGSGSESLMRQILISLENNYLKSLTISDLAQQFGYHKDHLSRLINAKLGCGFNHYINVLRARHAANLIRSSSESLTEIAYQSGFSSTRTFYRAFQSFYNITPAEYKRQKAPEIDADREVLKNRQDLN